MSTRCRLYALYSIQILKKEKSFLLSKDSCCHIILLHLSSLISIYITALYHEAFYAFNFICFFKHFVSCWIYSVQPWIYTKVFLSGWSEKENWIQEQFMWKVFLSSVEWKREIVSKLGELFSERFFFVSDVNFVLIWVKHKLTTAFLFAHIIKKHLGMEFQAYNINWKFSFRVLSSLVDKNTKTQCQHQRKIFSRILQRHFSFL